jgi:hypothetical protein
MKKSAKRFSIASLLVATLVGMSTECQAYQIWAGTQNFEDTMVQRPADWSRLARKTYGLNINWAKVALRPDNRAAGIALFATAHQHAYQVQPHPDGPVTTANSWEQDRAAAWGYTIEYIYTYGQPGNNWTENEYQIMRNWLDNNGYPDIKIAYNGRSIGNTDRLSIPLVEGCGIENDPARWVDPNDSRAELFRWITDPNNAATQGELCVLHTKLRGFLDETDADSVYRDCRLFTRYIIKDLLGDRLAYARSNNLAFSFFGKTDAFVLLPETDVAGANYMKTSAGLWLSLIEQRDHFSGKKGAFPTDAECNSTIR